MDWSGIATAIADRERARLGLPTRQQEADTRAKRVEDAAAAASNLETAGVNRDLLKAKIAEMPGEAALRDQATQALIDERKSRTERANRPPVEKPLTGDAFLLSLPPDKQAELLKFKGQLKAAGKPPKDTTVSDNNRLDRSYQYVSTKIGALAKPFQDQATRLSTLAATVNQRTPQADALIAPELLTVMAGGQGSGLRMNEAEIARIVKGRSNLEGLKAALNQWQMDPTKALTITDAQRSQIHDLLTEVQRRAQAKMTAINAANDAMIDAPDVHTHRQILANLQKTLSQDAGASADEDISGLINDYAGQAGLVHQ